MEILTMTDSLPTRDDTRPPSDSTHMKSFIKALSGFSLLCVALSPALAEDAPDDRPFMTGVYISPMATGVFQTKKDKLPETGFGGTFALGYRKHWYAMELTPTYVKHDGIDVLGGGVNALLFPLKSLPNTYLQFGIAALQYKSVPTNDGVKEYNTLNILAFEPFHYFAEVARGVGIDGISMFPETVG